MPRYFSLEMLFLVSNKHKKSLSGYGVSAIIVAMLHRGRNKTLKYNSMANVFLYYAFDHWVQRNHSDVPFEKYADNAVCHFRT